MTTYDDALILQTKVYTGQAALACPACGGTYLHVERIVIGARGEDAGGVLLDVNGITGAVAHRHFEDQPHLPSARRHWVTLYLDCELCGATTPATLAQHKGMTYVHRAEMPPAPRGHQG